MNYTADKAYNNPGFLNSREARTVRILCEYLEPEKRLNANNVKNTVVFFGSARTGPEKNGKLDTSRYYWAAEELAFKLAEWSRQLTRKDHAFHICTGGGPGIMEAANRGADRAGAMTIGYNVSLPFEQNPNEYITPELNFEFHYFFMRKLWFLYHAKAIIVFPGGMGTLDELFEVLTLVQTKKLGKPDIPILLFDREFWEKLINFNMMVECGVISQEDLDLFSFFQTPEEGFDILKKSLEKMIDDINTLIK